MSGDARARASAAGVRWDLTHVFPDASAAREALARAEELACALGAEADAVRSADAVGVADVLTQVSELVELRDLLDPSYGYAGLRLLADSADDEARDLVAACETTQVVVAEAVRAVAVAVGSRPELVGEPALGPFGHWVAHQVSRAAERLDPQAEAAFASRTATAATAWGRLSQDVLTAATVPLDTGEGLRERGVVELRDLRNDPDRDVRRRALAALHDLYRTALDVSAACLDAAIADRVAEDRLRRRDDAMAATLAADGVSRATVEDVLAVTEQRSDLVARWYERKRQALGVERVEPYDRYGPVGAEAPAVAWPEALDLSVESFESLAAGLGGFARALADAGGIDAEPRPRKSGAIFCSPLPRPRGGVVFLNFHGSAKGVVDLAHELGHATHYAVAAESLPWLVAVEPPSAAFDEVPSTLAELCAAELLAARLGGDAGRAALHEALELLLALLFDAAVLTRFEQDACLLRAEGRALTPRRLEELWLARDESVNGRLAEALGFMHWPHPFEARFYGYQYTYAILAALCLLPIRREDPEAFGHAYVDMLRATGTGNPAELLARCGLDVGDASVWHRGFDELERICELAW